MRTWRRDGVVVAVGFHDGPEVVRLAVDPAAAEDAELAGAVHAYLRTDAAPADVEVRAWPVLHDRLTGAGWTPGEPWTPLVLDLADPVPDPGIDVEVVTADRAEAWTAVHQAAFGMAGAPRTDRWTTMAAGPAWERATCLLGHDASGSAVAGAVVWAADPGLPGLVEPLGAHPDHRGHGYGVAITRAAAAALRSAGSSQAWVATPAANTGGVAAYASAGFTRLPDVRDLSRPRT
ncbi:GNAT family N-acetyltransferase [Klenkia brasiliensis]|uniref:GNAT family N-acetyltransferase n=1 Tax=Klenkia brasiliensis TaxID=333142 RepID=UPI001A97A189|nr:GNAT family N-acetyltransferase [Klenkia brasiliensis]